MRRRTALQALGITSTAAVSGCFGYGILGGNAGGYVTLSNADEVEHNVTILIRDGGSTEFDKKITIGPGSNQEFEDAFGGGRYTVEVELEDGANRKTDLNVGSCSSIRLLVTIRNGELNISQGYCD